VHAFSSDWVTEIDGARIAVVAVLVVESALSIVWITPADLACIGRDAFSRFVNAVAVDALVNGTFVAVVAVLVVMPACPGMGIAHVFSARNVVVALEITRAWFGRVNRQSDQEQAKNIYG